MNTSRKVIALFGAALIAIPCFAQETASPNAVSLPGDSPKTSNPQSPSVATSPVAAPASTSATGQPSEAEMMKQMAELAKLNENHKLLGDLSGTWSFTVKSWMNGDPSTKPSESKGVAVRKPMMDGRFYVMDVNGKMQLPGPDGKMKDFNFKGMSVEGYDNVKKKFVGTWMDNMGTGMMSSEGTYDPATKSFNYTGQMEMMPGMTQKIREVIKIVDKDHHTFEWYEDRGGKEAKTMEIAYTRSKGK